MKLPEHPCAANVLDHLRAAGPKGLRASFLVDLIDKVQPYPPAIVLLRQLVDAGYMAATPMPMTTGSTLVLTDEGAAELAGALKSGARTCHGVTTARWTFLTGKGILDFLGAVERGEVTLIPDANPSEVYAGIVTYSASNGCRIAIFNDCNEWDYIEWIEANGERVTYEDIDREMPDVDRYQPSREVAEVAYKIPRVTTKRPAGAADLDADARAFGQIREVLDGKRRLRLDGTSSKMLRIMLGGGDTDSVITLEAFVVHFGPQKQRRPCWYYRRLGPRAMSELLERAGVTRVTEALVIGLPAGEVPRTHTFPRWSFEPKLMWIVPTKDAVKIIVRGSPERWQAPFTQAVPADGPLALPELREWAPVRRYRDFETPLPCPVCGVGSTRYGSTADGALICQRCGRSFEHGEPGAPPGGLR